MACFLQNPSLEVAMGRFIGAVIVALAMSTVALSGQQAANLMQDVKTVGCIRLWKPATGDPAKMPSDRQPGLAGIYLLTPIAASPTTAADMPTYLITPSGTLNFSQQVGHKVEIVGVSQPAPIPLSPQDIVTAPTMRPEERPSTDGMPRLTVTTLKRVAEGCP
jgi:hypothetical protein